MIDLVEAGRRLGDTRVGPTPPPDEIRSRLTRRIQRRRRIVGGGAISAVAVVVAVALIVIVTNYKGHPVSVEVVPNAPTSTVTATPGVAGSTPYDYQRLRLWLPPGWSTSTSNCHAGNQIVFFPGNNPSATSCVGGDAGVILVVRAFTGNPPASSAQKAVNGIAVDVVQGMNGLIGWVIPGLQAEIDFHTGPAEKVAETLEPSPLQDLLTESLPISVPTGWQTVTFEGFQAKVPPNWPVHHIVTTTTGNSTSVSGMPPGICHPPLFQRPSVYLGGGFIFSCPSMAQTTEPPIDDGLWLQSAGFSTPLWAQLPGTDAPERLITIGLKQALVMAGDGDSVQVEIVSGNHQIEAFIGLGTFPEVAAAILSSITPISQ